MTTLHNVALPHPLQHEQPPTLNQLINQIDPWILYHLKATLLSRVHYENQLYGPVNTFILAIFLARRRFMTIPQSLIRRGMTDEEIEEDMGNVSFGSTGALHESRDLPGSETAKLIPDFLIVKVEPTLAPPRNYTIVCMIEVKRNTETKNMAQVQMEEYMDQLLSHSRSDDFCGYLMEGERVSEFRYHMVGGEEVPYIARIFNLLDPEDQFTRALCEISITNWNA